MNRHIFGGSRVNRDRRDASFARAVIARAWQLHQDSKGGGACEQAGESPATPLPECGFCGATPADEKEAMWHHGAECVGAEERFR